MNLRIKYFIFKNNKWVETCLAVYDAFEGEKKRSFFRAGLTK